MIELKTVLCNVSNVRSRVMCLLTRRTMFQSRTMHKTHNLCSATWGGGGGGGEIYTI